MINLYTGTVLSGGSYKDSSDHYADETIEPVETIKHTNSLLNWLRVKYKVVINDIKPNIPIRVRPNKIFNIRANIKKNKS